MIAPLSRPDFWEKKNIFAFMASCSENNNNMGKEAKKKQEFFELFVWPIVNRGLNTLFPGDPGRLHRSLILNR